MTCIANYPTKRAFREAVANTPDEVHIEDPSIVRPRSLVASDLAPGEQIFVTNHPKRSWFAHVVRRLDGKIRVV